MEHKVESDEEKRPPNDNRKRRSTETSMRKELPSQKEPGFWGKLKETEMSKTAAIWSCVASIVLTMIVGFWWGGWVTNATALKMVSDGSRTAVLDRLAGVCVAEFDLDADKEQKLVEMKEVASYQRGNYVATQGWVTFAGDAKPDTQVAAQCARLIVAANP